MVRSLVLLLLPARFIVASASTADPVTLVDASCSPNAQTHAYAFAGTVDASPALGPFEHLDPTGQDFELLDFGAVQVFDGATDCAPQGGGSVGLCTQEYPDCCGLGTGVSCCVAMSSSMLAAFSDPCGKVPPGDPCAADASLCCGGDDQPPCPICIVCKGDGDREAGLGGGFFHAGHHGNVFEVVGNVVAYPLLQKYPPFAVGSDGNGDGVITELAPDCRERAPGNQGSFVTSCPAGVDGGRWVFVVESYRPDPDGGVNLESPLQIRFPAALEGAPAGFIRTFSYP